MTNRKTIIWIALAALALGRSQLNGIIPSNPSSPASSLLTPEQINGINLEQQLVRPGDLPEGFTAGNPGSTVPERFKDFPPAQYQVSVELTAGGSWAGNTTVFLYGNADDIEKAFNPEGKAYDESNALEGLGEKSSFLKLSIPYGTGGSTLDAANAFWIRCSAVVEIRLITSNDDDVKNYALALDQRITPYVCNHGQNPAPVNPTPAAEIASGETPVETVKPAADCPYQEDADQATITAMIEAEATAANNEDTSIIRAIFDTYVTIRFIPDGTVWHDPLVRYRQVFDEADIVNSKHFGIRPTGQGITADKAWFISGSSGTYIPNVGDPKDYYNEPGKDNWVLKRNSKGCWVISEFSFY
ncbi:MAG: hypothetical protein WBM17_12290 [Anaerolineales bacterium]